MPSDSDTASEEATRAAEEGFGDWSEDDAFDAEEGDSGSATRGGSQKKLLTDLDEALRGAGLDVIERDGWKQRSNRIGGYDGGPIGVILHHTAGGPGADGEADVNFILTKPEAAPVSNLYLDRKGRWWVLAAGTTNTNGKGGPWGPIPSGGANRRVIGIEAGNRGDNKEPWPEVMQDSYVRGVAALADRYGIDSNNVLSHHEWSPGRKHDPAGPSRFGKINNFGTWDMDKFRAEVNEARKNRSTVEARSSSVETSDDGKYLVQPGDAWWGIAEKTMGDPRANWEALAAANGGKDRVLLAGQLLTIPGKGSAGAGSQASAGSTAAFPGEARRGMTGPVVVAWQEALIAHRIIADTAGNRDGDYGEGLEKTVLELQQSWDWSDADGIAGPGTWKKLQSGGS